MDNSKSGSYWYCPNCGEEVSVEVAAGDDECPFCGEDMLLVTGDE